MKIRFNTVEEEWNEQAPKFLLRKLMTPFKLAFYIFKVIAYLALIILLGIGVWSGIVAGLIWVTNF